MAGSDRSDNLTDKAQRRGRRRRGPSRRDEFGAHSLATPAHEGQALPADRPVVILGCQRSGTTGIARLFTRVLGYTGRGEGHLWPAVAAAWTELDSIVKQLGGTQSRPYREFSIGHIGVGKVKRKISSAMADLFEQEFGPRWVDKTPGARMVRAVPMLKDALPGIRFVFMRRRGIENVMSQRRRFPNRSFERCCEVWSETMAAWLDVRDGVSEQSIEIDQIAMATRPDEIAASLCAFLGEGAEVEAAVRDYLGETRSEQTSAVSAAQTIALADAGWDSDEMRTFSEKCAAMMVMYGYSFEGERASGSDAPMSMPLTFTKSGGVSVDSTSGETAFKWDGLRLVCANNGGAESVTVGNIMTAGQNTFESDVKVGGGSAAKTVSLVVTIRDAAGVESRHALSLSRGAREDVVAPLPVLEGPLEINVRATAAGGPDGITNVTLLRPRLTFRPLSQPAFAMAPATP